MRGLPCWWAGQFVLLGRRLARLRGGATYAVAVNLSERHDCWFTVDGTVQSMEAEALEERKRLFGSKWGEQVGFRFLWH